MFYISVPWQDKRQDPRHLPLQLPAPPVLWDTGNRDKHELDEHDWELAVRAAKVQISSQKYEQRT